MLNRAPSPAESDPFILFGFRNNIPILVDAVPFPVYYSPNFFPSA